MNVSDHYLIPNRRMRSLVVGGLALLLLVGMIDLVQQRVRSEEAGSVEQLYRGYLAGLEKVRQHYVEEVGYEQMTTATILGMLRTLDPHSNFYDRKSFEEMRLEQRSQYYGIGATIQQRFGGVYIIEPFRNTPALRAGLRFGDRITAIDGKPSSDWNSDQVRDHLRGELGTRVTLTIERVGAAEPMTLTIERGAVDLPSISGAFMITETVGYVALSRGFHSTTADELSSSIAKLKSSGMTSMIVDLRGNPGGFLDQAIRVADKMLQQGQTIVSVRGREGRTASRDWTAESGAPETMPIVVLIDESSASASEIVAGAIQDHDRGLIVGEPSFGKGLVQTIFPLKSGAGLTLTTARYYTPSGRLIQRDYSSGSSYEYLFRRQETSGAEGEKQKESPSSPSPYRTGLGRSVFGGGGIEPDIRVESEEVTADQGRLWTTGLFSFVRQLLGGGVAGGEAFRQGPLQLDHIPQPDEFPINDLVMEAYRAHMAQFLLDHPTLGLTETIVEREWEWARQKIREEVLIAFYGLDKQRQMTVATDPQLQRALQEVPQAARLAERAEQVRRQEARR
jgi:carboxyl-terminal processing protease